MAKQRQTYQADYKPAGVIQRQYHISQATLRRWADNGTVQCVRYGTKGKRLYNMSDLCDHLGVQTEEKNQQKTETIIYARVSSVYQKEDLQRQIKDLQTAYPQHTVLSDIGSGLNFTRKGLLTLLERVLRGVVQEVVVMHKDRLCRYGVELLEFIFKKAGTRFVVHGQDAEPNDTRELADDLLAITTVFVARHNGKRSATNRRRRKRAREAEGDQANQESHESHQDSNISHQNARC